jgi:hypothetical protein
MHHSPRRPTLIAFPEKTGTLHTEVNDRFREGYRHVSSLWCIRRRVAIDSSRSAERRMRRFGSSFDER